MGGGPAGLYHIYIYIYVRTTEGGERKPARSARAARLFNILHLEWRPRVDNHWKGPRTPYIVVDALW